MTSSLVFLLAVISAYLLGSLSSAIIVCRLRGLPDPRSQGSGNPGATNVLRFGGRRLAIIVLAGDVLKGLLPTLLANILSDDSLLIGAVALASFSGHIFPLFFGFRGGKGVATAIGAIAGISWLLALALIVIWLISAKVFRISSLSALLAALAAPLLSWPLLHEPAYTLLIAIISLILLIRHKANIVRLLQGQEPRIGEK